MDAKLVIDIRNNFGGSGGLNKTLGFGKRLRTLSPSR